MHSVKEFEAVCKRPVAWGVRTNTQCSYGCILYRQQTVTDVAAGWRHLYGWVAGCRQHVTAAAAAVADVLLLLLLLLR